MIQLKPYVSPELSVKIDELELNLKDLYDNVLLKLKHEIDRMEQGKDKYIAQKQLNNIVDVLNKYEYIQQVLLLYCKSHYEKTKNN